MSAASARTSLSTRLTRRMLWIAAAVLLSNITFVAYYDAADREALLSDVLGWHIADLDRAVTEAPTTPPVIRDAVSSIYVEHPDAYGYVVVDPGGRIVDAQNQKLLPSGLLAAPVAASDWVARQPGIESTEAVASHLVKRDDGAYRVFFVIADDPADLIGYEIWDEFLGHVWLPVLPTLLLLIAGTLFVIRRDLAPVAAGAQWARGLRPGFQSEPFNDDRAPSDIADLTDTVNRAVARLNTELEREKHRAAEAAHALRTPVAVLVAQLDGLPDGPAFDRLREDVSTLSRTVTQFLVAAGADRLELHDAANVDLNHIAEDTVARLTPYAMVRDCEIAFLSSDAPVPVRGAGDAIDLALTNLIENAIHHGRGAPIEVQVGPGPQIVVSDRGPGLPDDHNGRLFEPFWRSSDAEKGGAGLGLSIVQRIQRAHDGRVDAANRVGGGACSRCSTRSRRQPRGISSRQRLVREPS